VRDSAALSRDRQWNGCEPSDTIGLAGGLPPAQSPEVNPLGLLQGPLVGESRLEVVSLLDRSPR
jgi:hypothetical protein